ncbi:MAG: TonB-dependent receptor [Flavobacteriales bacterium]|nr:TonB-dependent receptor [Flavobacteriales bacterium]
MVKKPYLVFLFCLLVVHTFAQTGNISGKLTDHSIGEPLIGATVLIGPGIGTITDLDGKFSIDAEYGDYTLSISYVGYETISQPITLDRKVLILKDLPLKTTTLTEVQVVADFARERETPVAFTNILPAKIEEELGAQDLPMILNSTPGVYATQQGGGDGDARVTIRGFSQRNVAVMIDGIPVNDMENGWVFWSNWFGLDAVTRNIQVQRGLGASKIAIPSVGGTMNILTKGIDQKQKMSVKQEIGSYGYTRTSLGYNSGRLENGWGYTIAASYKQRDGFADQTFSKGWFYFGKVEKMIGDHIISVTALGAPQRHGQRSFKQAIGTFSADLASEHMDQMYIDVLVDKDKGLNYNRNWGELDRNSLASNGDTISGGTEIVNEKLNYYHKPQFSLKDFWNINDKLHWSNMAYLSVGRGGGTGNEGNFPVTAEGQVNYQVAYETNKYGKFNKYTSNEQFSSSILYSGINNHMWQGFLSTLSYSVNDSLSISGGVDLRHYKGTHFRSVYDLLGGDVYFDNDNLNQLTNVKREGDKIFYHNEGIVKWVGGFTQAEFKTEVLSAFVNISGAYSGFKRIDYFKRKDIVIDDIVYEKVVSNNDIFFHNGTDGLSAYSGATITQSGDTTFVDNIKSSDPDGYILNATTYTNRSKEARFAETETRWIPGFTVKGGVNYNLTEKMNVFVNLGYISKSPRFNNVINRSNEFFLEIKNEQVKALELGYSFKSSKFSGNFNAYYTIWNNKPLDFAPTVAAKDDPDIRLSVNINGIDAIHKGMEFDFIYKLLKNLEWEGVISIGDWRWDSGDSVDVYDEAGNYAQTLVFDAKGILVGDAAQTQFGSSLKFIVKDKLFLKDNNAYIKTRFTYFGRNFSNFDPSSLDPVGNPNAFKPNGDPKQSWQMPDYYIFDLHAGYGFKLSKSYMNIRFSLFNVLNNIYITDAQNNSQFLTGNYKEFDAKSASVFMSIPSRYSLSIKISI